MNVQILGEEIGVHSGHLCGQGDFEDFQIFLKLKLFSKEKTLKVSGHLLIFIAETQNVYILVIIRYIRGK